MKKLLLFVVGGLLVSCSDGMMDSQAPASVPSIYPVAVPFVNSSLPDSWAVEKEGGFVRSININNTRKDVFTYNGTKIVEISHFSNSVLNGVSEFIYDSTGRLSSITQRNSSDQITLTRAFNYSNPNLIEEVNTVYNTSGVVTNTMSLFKKILNGNLVTYNFGTSQLDSYQYDEKQNVFSDLVVLDDLVLYYSNDKVGKNNRISNSSVFYFNGGVINTSTNQYVNKYDSNNRIVERAFLLSGVEHYKEKFTY